MLAFLALFCGRLASIEQRVEELPNKLTLEEKADLCHGSFLIGGVPRLGIPQSAMLDDRQGVRPLGDRKGTLTTLLPYSLTLAFAWDERAAEEVWMGVGEGNPRTQPARFFAPMIISSAPLAGRNFENFSKIPFLAGKIAAAYVCEVHGQKVGACSCLVVANDCENRLHFTGSNMDERTLRETYLLTAESSFRDTGV